MHLWGAENYKYCPQCGGELEERLLKPGEPPRLVCQACGFVFCGLMPLFHHERDYLRMQRPSEPLHLDQLVLYSDMARTIFQQIEQELQWMSSKQVNA